VTPPRFSIIMAAYNADETIESAIRSALLQTVDSLEVVVVDDGSVDETSERVRELAREDRRVRLFQQENRGPAAARNRATAEAQAELITVLDADDLLFPEYLERMGAALMASPKAGMAYTDAWLLDDTTGRVRRKSAMAYQLPPHPPPEDPGSFMQLLLEGNFIFVSTTSRLRVLQDVGPWHESVNAAEDYELWLRILAGGHPVIGVAGRLAIYRDRVGSNSHNLLQQCQSLRTIYALVAEEWNVDEATRVIARRRRNILDRLVRRHESEWRGRFEQVSRPLRQTRNALRDRGVWFDAVPPEVATVLEATGGSPSPSPATRTSGVDD
jgi:glycosyltransferase involved in cell wall biosynthesis